MLAEVAEPVAGAFEVLAAGRAGVGQEPHGEAHDDRVDPREIQGNPGGDADGEVDGAVANMQPEQYQDSRKKGEGRQER